MTLYKIIETIKMLALKHPNINSAYEGNIYDIMNADPQHKYASVIITQQSHTQDDTYDHYNFNIFYVDRLVDDMTTNRVQVQSTGKSMLSNIIKSFCDEFDAECETINFQTFTERFADECAGVYCTITIDMIKDMTCTEKYWDESWSAPIVSIKNQDKKVEFTANGTYVIDYDPTEYTGLGMVSVEVNVPDINGSYDEGYSEGKNDGIEEGRKEGIEEQKDKLESITIKDNGTYDKEDGYNKVVVEVPVPEILPSLDIELKAGDAGTFRPYGYDAVAEINYSVLPNYDIEHTFTENGTYEFDAPAGFSGFGHATLKVEVPDLNGSYDEGFDKGYAEGVEEGTSNAGAIIAETAQVLNITKNGVYPTKYSKVEDFGIEVTGYFDDGTPFYEYAYLNDKAFITYDLITKDSKIEVWWKPSNEWDNTNYGDGIVGTIEGYYPFALKIEKGTTFIGNAYSSSSYDAKKEVELENKWYHLTYSYNEGLFVDGEFCGKQTNTPGSTQQNSFCINLIKIAVYFTQANGYFGMVRLDDNIYIPTANGYINYVTKQPLEVYQDGVYDFYEMPEFDGNLIKSINVNVAPKVSLKTTGLKLGSSTFNEVPDLIDFNGVTDYSSMFDSCYNINTIPLIDTSSAKDMGHMFSNCSGLITIPELNTSNVTTMSYMFYSCSKLTAIPKLDTSKVTNMNYMFYTCNKLTEIPEIDTSKVTNMSNMFYSCNALQKLPSFDCSSITTKDYYPIRFSSDNSTLTTVGGFKNMKYSWTNNYGLYRCAALTYESCLNILNNLYDFTGNGETPNSSQGQLKVHRNFLNVVGDQISIGTNKGWQITA